MANAQVAVCAKRSANHARFVIVIYDDRARTPADNTNARGAGLICSGVFFFGDSRWKTDVFAICRATSPAPTIQSILLFVVKRKKLSRGGLFISTFCTLQHLTSHLRRALLIRLSGSAAVAAPVSLRFMPHIRLRKFSRLLASDGLCAAFSLETGGLRFMPSRLALARPLAFSPPSGFLPSDRCQAGDFTMLPSIQMRGR